LSALLSAYLKERHCSTSSGADEKVRKSAMTDIAHFSSASCMQKI
jgi:hypothetical protein